MSRAAFFVSDVERAVEDIVFTHSEGHDRVEFLRAVASEIAYQIRVEEEKEKKEPPNA